MYKNKEFLAKITAATGSSLFNELAKAPVDPNRPNRLCVTISDIHLTDGTVGFQNLDPTVWDEFFDEIADTSAQEKVEEVVLVFDGDFIDLIRSGSWAQNNFYPWQRSNKTKFEDIVLEITKNIISKHFHFFNKLKSFETDLKQKCPLVKSAEIIILLGNHDKELMLCNVALSYFYEHALGRKAGDFSDEERIYIGSMYGDRDMFMRDKTQVPYFPFYHADKGFRFFTTHGQWRDSENSRLIEATASKPGWSVKDGWKPEVWEKLNYTPFLDACFGDSVAAGVLSTFIYKTKEKLAVTAPNDDQKSIHRLNRILDELDLYRPSYLAVKRIIEESRKLRQKIPNSDAATIVEETLTQCIHDWLNWDFTMKTATGFIGFALKIARFVLKIKKYLGHKFELSVILNLMKLLDKLSHYQKKDLKYKDMIKFPGFLPPYTQNGFQIHGEGHTHIPLQAELNLNLNTSNFPNPQTANLTYINFGTWRDQIVKRDKPGYRRRGVLRAFTILDLQPDASKEENSHRRFEYYTEDFIMWGDSLDRI